MARRVVAFLLVAAALLLFSQIFFFYFRDNFSTHYPIKTYSAHAFRNFDIPFWNFGAGGGQPLAGNPNTLSFYPDNLLYLLLPAHTAFNLHFLLHLLAGAWAGGALARRYGCSEADARLTGLIYVLSGPVISTVAFYNLVIVVALLPLVLLALEQLIERPGWAPAALLGSAFGLQALAAEPVSFAGSVLAALILLLFRAGLPNRRVIAFGALAVGFAIVVASPLLIAYQEIAPESERSTWKFSSRTVLAASLTPSQAAQILLGPFRGFVTEGGSSGYQTDPHSDGWPPFLLSMFLGSLVLAAWFTNNRWIRPYRWMAVIFLLLSLGRFNPLLAALVERFAEARIWRYPQKFMLHFTLACVVLISAWLSARARTMRRPFLIGALMLILALAAWVLATGELHAANRLRLLAGTAIAAGILLLSMGADRPLLRNLAIALTILPMAWWAVRTAPVDWFAPYRFPPALLPEPQEKGERLARPVETEPLRAPEPSVRSVFRVKAQLLDPLFGNAFGAAYGPVISPDSMDSAMSRIVRERVYGVPILEHKLRYFRINGCTSLISRYPLDDPSLRLLESVNIEGNAAYRYAVQGAAPYARRIQTLIPARSVQEAVRWIESDSYQASAVIGPASRRNMPLGPIGISRLRREGQRVVFDVRAPEGGALVLNETYFSRWDVRARRGSDTRSLSIFPADIDRLGMEIPPGEWTVELRFGRRRTLVAISWVLSSLALLAALFFSLRSRNLTASPARKSDPAISTEAAGDSSAT